MVAVIEFTSFEQWCNKATSWFQTCGVTPEKLICIDAKGRICRVGSDWMRARDEGAFPVRAHHYRNLVATPSDSPEFEGPTAKQREAAVERTLAKRMGGGQ